MIKIALAVVGAWGVCLVFVVLTLSLPVIFPSHYTLDPSSVVELKELGLRALESKDVPVSSLLLFKGTVVGRGFNTVRKESIAGGHAEINSISDAIRTIGFQEFAKLNRDSLMLISTFEPCLMCRGALIEYGVKHVVYLKPKPIMELARKELYVFRFLWTRSKAGPAELQDSLFTLYPGFHQ